MEFTAGATVEVLEAGKWVGPFTVTALQGRTPDHLVLSGPNGTFETFNDAPFNVRPVEAATATATEFDRTNTGTWAEGNGGTWETHCARTEDGEQHFTAATGECLSCTYYSGVKTRTEYLAQFSDDALAAMCGYGYYNYATALTETATLEEISAVRKYRADRDAAWLRDNPQAEAEDFTEGPDSLVTAVTIRVFGGSSHEARAEAATEYLEMLTDIGYRVSVDSYETTAKETESGYPFTEFRYF